MNFATWCSYVLSNILFDCEFGKVFIVCGHFNLFQPVTLRWGICVPDACGELDVAVAIEDIIGMVPLSLHFFD